MKHFSLLAVAAAIFMVGCVADQNVVYDEFKEVSTDKWSWHDARSFTFTITENDYIYNLDCGLRITGNYKYSNIWLVYQLDGPSGTMKEQFQIPLSDNTGKWLGKGNNNLISYQRAIISGLKLKPGKYTLKLNQNMRDEELQAVSDIGVRVSKVSKVY
jgi:gliding motility-associated lipoprotein GldH